MEDYKHFSNDLLKIISEYYNDKKVYYISETYLGKEIKINKKVYKDKFETLNIALEYSKKWQNRLLTTNNDNNWMSHILQGSDCIKIKFLDPNDISSCIMNGIVIRWFDVE